MFPQTQEQAHHTAMTQQQQFKMRYGCFAARIGADIQHKLGVDMPVEPPQYGTALNVRSATRSKGGKNTSPYVMQEDDRQATPHGNKTLVPQLVKAGTKVTLTVEDITRYPDEAEDAKWICTHPECAAKRFDSKRELLAEHPNNKDLARDQQKHMYYAVFEESGQPAVAARPEERDSEGKVTKKAYPGREATGGRVILLSDEE